MREILKLMAVVLLVSGMIIFLLGIINDNTNQIIAGGVIMMINYITIKSEEAE